MPRAKPKAGHCVFLYSYFNEPKRPRPKDPLAFRYQSEGLWFQLTDAKHPKKKGFGGEVCGILAEDPTTLRKIKRGSRVCQRAVSVSDADYRPCIEPAKRTRTTSKKKKASKKRSSKKAKRPARRSSTRSKRRS